ncbi:hypothetical protein [Limnospira sp. Paracas R14]|uniref:hypothetical protein n=1 Tax=Limnospira sp. Paracas R14 TaxID=2981108 RepID=UPI0028E112E3|nr:hypothetical protein [Limnospira sp. Paracas R14]
MTTIKVVWFPNPDEPENVWGDESDFFGDLDPYLYDDCFPENYWEEKMAELLAALEREESEYDEF